jgi:hypothetical protein
MSDMATETVVGGIGSSGRRAIVALGIVVVGAARADGPAAHPTPAPVKVVTQAWLRETLRDEGTLGRMIDEANGVVFIDDLEDSANENSKPVVTASRLCGAKLHKAWPKREAQIRAVFEHTDPFLCRNRPGPPVCAFGVLNEYTAFTYLVFRSGADDVLKLDAVMRLDGLLNVSDKSSLIYQERWVQQQLMKLRNTDCAGNPVLLDPQYILLRTGAFTPRWPE